MIIRAGRSPGGQRRIDPPLPRTRRWVRCGISFVTVDPRTFWITFTLLLYLTLRSLARVVRGFSGDIGERVVIVGRIIVIFTPGLTFSIALLILDGNAGTQGLAVRNRKVRATRFSLSNVLTNSYLDTLVS